ncbi:MAG: FkbM family methyltransferase [Ferruginibacter sp.]
MNSFFYEFLAKKVRPIELAAVFKKMLFIKRKFFLINDQYWYLDPVSNFGLRLLKEHKYEPEMTEKILSLLKTGDTFIDLGANEGYFSILASTKVGNEGKVHSIEPQNRLWEVILRNINKNGCYNINMIPFAISDKKNELSISLSPSINTGSSSIVKESRKKLWKNQKIFSTTLDDLFYKKEITQVCLIKIDIEGYEYFALKGAAKLLEMHIIRNILIEFHPAQLSKLGQTVTEIESFLKSYGYIEYNGVYTCEMN